MNVDTKQLKKLEDIQNDPDIRYGDLILVRYFVDGYNYREIPIFSGEVDYEKDILGLRVFTTKLVNGGYNNETILDIPHIPISLNQSRGIFLPFESDHKYQYRLLVKKEDL